MQKHLPLVLTCFLLLLSLAVAQDEKKDKKVLKNADIVLMTQNHFDDETLIKIIEVSETDFDISGDALIALKNQGVSPAVMRAMLDASKHKQAIVQETPSNPGTANSNSSSTAPVASAGIPPVQTQAGNNTPQLAVRPLNATADSDEQDAAMNAAAAAAYGRMQVRRGGANISPQQMAAMQAQIAAMGMGGMGAMGGMGGMRGGMFGMNYSAEQLPHVFLMLGPNQGRQEISSSQALIGQSKFKGGMGAGGMALRSLATEGLSFAAMGAGPAGMMAMSAFSMASGFMPGMRPGVPTITYVWGLSGRKSARELDNTSPMFELNYGDIPGVDPDAYEPVVVKLVQTNDNYRLVGATQTKMNSKNMMSGGGPEGGKWISEERWPSHADKEERGFYILHVDSSLDPGEYAVVLRPVKGYKATPAVFGGGAQVFYSVWDFSVPGTPIEQKGKKKKKH